MAADRMRRCSSLVLLRSHRCGTALRSFWSGTRRLVIDSNNGQMPIQEFCLQSVPKCARQDFKYVSTNTGSLKWRARGDPGDHSANHRWDLITVYWVYWCILYPFWFCDFRPPCSWPMQWPFQYQPWVCQHRLISRISRISCWQGIHGISF